MIAGVLRFVGGAGAWRASYRTGRVAPDFSGVEFPTQVLQVSADSEHSSLYGCGGLVRVTAENVEAGRIDLFSEGQVKWLGLIG